jgi:hypothetical protein
MLVRLVYQTKVKCKHLQGKVLVLAGVHEWYVVSNRTNKWRITQDRVCPCRLSPS